MSTDYEGNTPAVGDVYVLAAPIRRINEDDTVILTLGAPGSGLRVALSSLAPIASLISGVSGYEDAYALAASDSGSGVTEMDTRQNGLTTEEIGILVPSTATLTDLLVSWCSDNIPAGDWTATLDRKAAGEDSWSVVATFDFQTS